VYPFLLFAMGAAVPFALSRRRGDPRRVRRHVLRRAALLFALGLLLNAIETAPPLNLETFRIPGVLQRIALVYGAAAALTERTSLRTQMLAALAGLSGYWALLTLVPVPGVGSGVLTPEGNLASYVDRALLGRHLLTPVYDPEGLLSTIPAIVTALAGVFAGAWLKEGGGRRRTLMLWSAGFAAMVAGFAWNRVLPINKNLWTSSFALFSAGLAAQTIAICHWLVDTLRWHAWSRPLAAYGRNTLAVYFLSVGFDAVLTRWRIGDGSLKGVLYRTGFASWLRPCCGAEAASLAYAIVYVALWGFVLFELHRRRIFIGV
jgi:predicted acyltransferase